MIKKRFNNLYVLSLINKINGERIYKVECVCGRKGRIPESGLSSRISCGCTKLVRRHVLGVSRGTYRFTKFLREENNRHVYQVDCSACGKSSEAYDNFHLEKCPSCPYVTVFEGVSVNMTAESERIGITPEALWQRMKRLGLERALSMPRSGRGGMKGVHGKFMLNGVMDYIPGHLARIGNPVKKSRVYYWVRKGMKPLDALMESLARAGVEIDHDYSQEIA